MSETGLINFFKRLAILTLALILLVLGFPTYQAEAQTCTPQSAQICVSSDDWSDVYIGGTSIGNFPYAGAPGTGGAKN